MSQPTPTPIVQSKRFDTADADVSLLSKAELVKTAEFAEAEAPHGGWSRLECGSSYSLRP